MDRESTGRRIKAARSLIPITVPELAERLGLPGLGAKTLGSIERGERALRPQEIAPIAQALEVPEEFLTGAKPAGETQLDRIEQRLIAMHSMLVNGQDVIDRLDRLERALGGQVDHVRDEVSETIRTLGRAIVEGRPPEDESDRQPAPGPPDDAATKAQPGRARSRTPARP